MSPFYAVLRLKSLYVFSAIVSPICNGGKLTCGLQIQRNDLFDASKSF